MKKDVVFFRTRTGEIFQMHQAKGLISKRKAMDGTIIPSYERPRGCRLAVGNSDEYRWLKRFQRHHGALR